MRVTPASSTHSRQATRSSTPRAQAMAAFIGLTWVTTTRPSRPQVGDFGQLLAGGPDPNTERRQRLTPTRRVVGVCAPLGPHLGGHGRRVGPLESPVVQLDPSVVDLDRPSERRRRFTGPAQRTRHDPVRRRQCRRQPGRLGSAPLRQPRVGPSQQQPGRVRRRFPVTDDVEHQSRRPTSRSTDESEVNASPW